MKKNNKGSRSKVALSLYGCATKDSPLGLEVSSAPSERGGQYCLPDSCEE